MNSVHSGIQENLYQRKTTSPLRNRAQGNINLNNTQKYFTQQNLPRTSIEQQQIEIEPTLDSHTNLSRDKLQSKIDAQTERLKYLDNYRVICEKRIRDLAPSHPLPVVPSHCGQPNPDIADMMTRINPQISTPDTNQSIEVIRLRQQVDMLSQEKFQLEVSLRDETLANEEQRNYIEILRNTIDQKMESLGFGELLSYKNLPQGHDPVAIYTIISELKRELDGYKHQCKTLNEQIQVNNEEITQKVQIEQEQTENIKEKENEIQQITSEAEDLKKVNLELQNCINQNSKEKNDLLEYIEDNVKQIDILGKELENERVRINEINSEKLHLANVKVDLETSNRKLKERVEELEFNSQNLETQAETMKNTIRQLKNENETRQTQMEELTVKNQNNSKELQIQVESIKSKDKGIEELKQKQREINELNMNVTKQVETITEEKHLQEKKFKIEEESLKKKISMLDDFIHEQQSRTKKLEEKHDLEYELQKRTYEHQISGLEFNLTQNKKALQATELELNDMRKLKCQLLENNTKLDTELQQLQDRYDEKHEQFEQLKESLIYCQKELENLKQDHLKLQEKSEAEFQRREWLSNEREKLNSQLESATTKLQDEIMQKDHHIKKACQLERELTEQKSYLGRELTQKTDDMNYMTRQQDQTNNELKKVISLLEYTRQLKTDLEQKVNSLQRDHDNNLREKKIQEKVIADLKEENSHLYKNEERVKRLLEENEILKSQLRQKDRDISILEQRFKVTTGEVDSVEREFKRTQNTLCERELQVGSLGQQRAELQSKLKETETRLFEMHREKQEIESKLKAMQRQVDDILNENDCLRRARMSNEDEIQDLNQNLQKLRSRMTDQSIFTESYEKNVEELEMLLKQIAEKIKQFLDDLLQKLNASDILSNLVNRHAKEQMYLLIQNIDNSLVLASAEDRFRGITSIVHEFKNFTYLLEDQYILLINEFFSSQQDGKLLQTKVDQLQTRLTNFNTSDVVNLEKNKFLSNEIDTIRSKRLQTIQELNQVKDQDQIKAQTIKELESQIQTLQRENKFLVEKNLQSDEELNEFKKEWEDKRNGIEMNIVSLKHNEQKLSQIQKEKRELEDLISKIHSSIFDVNIQKVFGEWSRVLNDKFKAQNERLKQEQTLDNLERDLSALIKQDAKQDEATILRAQYLRREINDIEQKVQECDNKIDSLIRKTRNLEIELRQLEENEKVNKFVNYGNTQTITYLTKESQDLRNEIFEKTNRINQLEQDVEFYRQKEMTQNSTQLNTTQKQHAMLPPRFRGTGTIERGNNSLVNTFEKKLLDQNLCDIRNNSTSELNSHRILNLQPIKVEDYDYKPERHSSLNRQQPLYSLKPSTKQSLSNHRQASAKTLLEQDVISPIQQIKSPEHLMNDTQAMKENYNPQHFYTDTQSRLNKFNLGTTLTSPMTSTPLQARLSEVSQIFSNQNLNR